MHNMMYMMYDVPSTVGGIQTAALWIFYCLQGAQYLITWYCTGTHAIVHCMFVLTCNHGWYCFINNNFHCECKCSVIEQTVGNCWHFAGLRGLSAPRVCIWNPTTNHEAMYVSVVQSFVADSSTQADHSNCIQYSSDTAPAAGLF